MQAFGQDVVAVVNHLQLDEVILIGHSMGGNVIVEAALRLPERVIGLIGVDTFKSFNNTQTQEQIDKGMPSRESFNDTLLSWVHNVFPTGSDPTLVQKIADEMSAARLDIALGALHRMRSYRVRAPGCWS
jgi:pimeloyl-ACP methyl ester carboxylesterase